MEFMGQKLDYYHKLYLTTFQDEPKWWHLGIWKLNFPLKEKVFMWCTLDNKTPTWDRMKKIHRGTRRVLLMQKQWGIFQPPLSKLSILPPGLEAFVVKDKLEVLVDWTYTIRGLENMGKHSSTSPLKSYSSFTFGGSGLLEIKQSSKIKLPHQNWYQLKVCISFLTTHKLRTHLQ